MIRRGRPEESGAVAVMVAILAVLMLSMAAIAVDLSNAYSRKRDVQTQADFAALAGGSYLGSTVDPAMYDAVAEYLHENYPQNDPSEADPDGGTPDVSAIKADLQNLDPADGEAYLGTWDPSQVPAFKPLSYTLTVVTPWVHVDFGLAGIMDFNATNVQAQATVQIGTPAGYGLLPYYAVTGSGCDSGPQELTDPANGQVQPGVPSLLHPDDTNRASLTSVAPPVVALTPTVPPSAELVTVAGSQLAGITKVGFFRDVSLSPNFYEVTLPQANSNNNQVADIPVPFEVTSVEDVWWVRVFGPTTGSNPPEWSTMSEALPLRVGDSLLQCVGLSNSGNFGSIYLPRDDASSVNDMLAMNAALGPQDPLTLTVHPEAATAPFTCVDADPSVVSSGPNDREPDTNCVDTDTGLTANGTTAGLISGYDSTEGRLVEPNSPDCAGAASERSVTINPTSYLLNNDILTCFLTDDTTTIDQVSRPTYSGGARFSPSIYSSPRFGWVPVLSQTPDNGGSDLYKITDFRPAFITGQPKEATRANPWPATASAADQTDNGLTIGNNGVTSMQVVFFNYNALPAEPGGAPVGPYLGVGPKILSLID